MPLHFTGFATRHALAHPDEKPPEPPLNYERVLKYNKNHSKEDGKFTSGSGGSGGKKETKWTEYTDKETGQKMRRSTLPERGRINDDQVKAMGLEPGVYHNTKVGVMGSSHEERRKEPARSASANAEQSSRTIAADKKKNALHTEHDRAAKAHREAAKEHEKLGNTKEIAHHKAKAKEHYEKFKALRASKFEQVLKYKR